jgi:hypothetical protein
MVGEAQVEKKSTEIIESIVVTVIILVLFQTFIEDLAILAGWSWPVRKILVFTGVFFDVFFTIEFLVRLYNAVFSGRVREYLINERGWIDFLASIPLLILNSGPNALSVIAGEAAVISMGGILNILKVVKAIRIARILRLLRVLKIFKQIKYADSVMAQRHIAKITAITITAVVFTLFFFALVSGMFGIPSAGTTFDQLNARTAESYVSEKSIDLEALTVMNENILIVKKNGETIYTRFDNDQYRQWFSPQDYDYILIGDYGFFFDLRPINRLLARENVTSFCIVIVLVLCFLFYYSPHFAITITDPIHVMRRGLEEGQYNLEVRVPSEFADDDVFKLAVGYNEIFLPIKARNSGEESADQLDLKIDDIKDLFSEESE